MLQDSWTCLLPAPWFNPGLHNGLSWSALLCMTLAYPAGQACLCLHLVPDLSFDLATLLASTLSEICYLPRPPVTAPVPCRKILTSSTSRWPVFLWAYHLLFSHKGSPLTIQPPTRYVKGSLFCGVKSPLKKPSHVESSMCILYGLMFFVFTVSSHNKFDLQHWSNWVVGLGLWYFLLLHLQYI